MGLFITEAAWRAEEDEDAARQTCLAETTGCPLWECSCPECVQLEGELNDALGIDGPPQNAPEG